MLSAPRLGQALRRWWTPDGLQDQNIRFLTLDTAVQGVIGAGINTFLAVFLVRMGATNTAVGLLTALPALLTIFLSVPAGALAQAGGNMVRLTNRWRQPIRFTYLLVALVPLVATGENGAYLVVAVWALTALPMAILNVTFVNVVADAVPPAIRPRVNGNRWAILSIVTAACVAAFGGFLDLVGFPLGYQVVFVVSFLAGQVSIYLFGRIRIAETPGSGRFNRQIIPRHNVVGAVLGLASSFRREGPFARFVIAGFVYRLGLNLPIAVFPIFWIGTLNASDATIGLRTTAGQLALVAGYYLWGRFAARWGSRWVLILASLGLSIYPVATALVTSSEWLLPVAILWGAFAAGIDVSFFEALLRTSPPSQRGTFIAANNAFANLAIFVAPLVGTFLIGVIDIRLVLVLSGVLSVAGALMFVVLRVGQEAKP